MPRIAAENLRQQHKGLSESVTNANFSYKYPEGLNLKPGTPLHNTLVDRIMSRARESYDIMQTRHDSWRKIDKTLTSFVDMDTEEELLKAEDSRRPVRMVIPLSYATLQTLLTYWVGAFLQNDTIFQYKGVGPEDKLGALMMEHVVNYHVQKRKIALALHTQWRDALAYGIGIAAPRWERVLGKKQVPKARGIVESISGAFRPVEYQRNSVRTVTYEGNVLDNIDPYCYLPDPNVPVHKVQEGEYVGYCERSNIMNVLKDEKTSQGLMFNAQYVKVAAPSGGMTSEFYEEVDTERDRTREEAKHTTYSAPVDRVNMYVTLIPRDWKIGSGKFPEKYFFQVTGDRILTRMQPLGLDHDMYPVSVCAPEYDGHSAVPLSSLEVVYGLQETADWLLNSHIANVRKSINNTTIVDPYLVNMNDVNKAKWGGIWRLRRTAWGRGSLEGVAKQFPVVDVTQQHIADIGYINDIVMRTTGASDVLQGVVKRTSERRTAQEVRDTKLAAVSRVEKQARMGAMMSMLDIGTMFASHTQQFMSKDTYIEVAGEYEDLLREEYGITDDRLPVRPIDLIGDYDLVPVDPAIGKSEFVDTWGQILQFVLQAPKGQVDANGQPIPSPVDDIDGARVFKHWARLAGAKDVNHFVKKQPQAAGPVVEPDNIVAQRVAQGRYIQESL